MKYALLFALGLLVGSAAQANSLWDDAVSLFDSYGDLIPGHMEVAFDQYNGRGELVTSDRSTIAIWTDETGETQSRVISAERNGEDVTEERRDDPSSGAPPFGGPPDDDEEQSDNAFAGLARSPFDPEEQDHVTITNIGPVEIVEGVRSQVFEFRHQTSDRASNTGTAWLDTETGEPVLLRLSIEPLPRFISEFEMEQYFARDEQGRWVVRRLEFVGAGRILFLQRRIESRLIFSEYFRSR